MSSYTVQVILKGGQTVLSGPSTTNQADLEADLEKFRGALRSHAASVDGVSWYAGPANEIQAVHIAELHDPVIG